MIDEIYMAQVCGDVLPAFWILARKNFRSRIFLDLHRTKILQTPCWRKPTPPLDPHHFPVDFPLLKQPRTSENILKRQEKYTNKLCSTWRCTALKPRHLSPKILVEVHVQDLPWQHMFFFWSDHRKSLQTTFRQFFLEKITLPKINIGSWRMMVGRLNDLLVCAWLVWFFVATASNSFCSNCSKKTWRDGILFCTAPQKQHHGTTVWWNTCVCSQQL